MVCVEGVVLRVTQEEWELGCGVEKMGLMKGGETARIAENGVG